MNKLLVWRCVYCTYDNEPTVNICAACSRSRDPQSRDTSGNNGSGTADALKKQQKRIRHRKLEGPSCPRRIDLKRSDSEASVSSAGSSSHSSLSCSSSWLCAKCFVDNPLQNKACSSCSAERKKLSNFPHNLLSSREKPSSKDEYMGKKSCQLKPLPPLMSHSMWVCEECSQQNSIILAHCMVCGAMQTPQASTASQSQRSYSRKNKHSPTSAPPPLLNASNQDLITKPKIKEKTLIDPHVTDASSSQDIVSDETSQTYRDIVKYFKKLKTNFVDDSFRPCNKSIYGDDVTKQNNGNHGNHSNGSAGDVLWLRPHEIDAGNSGVKWTLFRTPLPTDIIQGSLGDCWLLSSLSVLADKPSIIEKIFLNKTVSNEGVYQVRLCKDGVWTEVIVDDYFPCFPNKKLMFAQSDRKQLWVPLIEKAVAKLFGGFYNLKAGHCGEGLQLLTGTPIDSIKMADFQDDLELFWGMLLSYKEAGYPIGVCCMGEEEQAVRQGLTTRHAYSLLNLYAGEHVRLVQLRNPWAKDTWTGKYNNKCPSWTKELRAELMVFEDATEAVFWIELTDFLRYFTIMDVCRLHQDWNEWRGSGTFSLTSPQVIYISVAETSCLDLCLVQPTRRGDSTLAAVDLCVGVVRCGEEDNSPQTVVEFSGRSLLSSVTCSTLVSPGTYMLVPISFLAADHTTPPKYTLACYADKNWCVWEGVGAPDLVSQVLYKVTLSKGQSRDALQGCSVYQLNKKIAGLVIAVENRNPYRYFHISSDSHNTSNVMSTRGKISTEDWIPPLSRMIIMILTQMDETCGFKIQSSYKFSLMDMEKPPVVPHKPPVSGLLHRVFPL